MSDSKSSNAVMMRVNISGYGGKAASVFAAFDRDTDLLMIVREAAEYEHHAREKFLHITNQPHDSHHDAVFTDEETKDAITAYLELEGLGLLKFGAKSSRAAPGNKIERDGMDAGGMKYRIQPDILNVQVAVLAACLYANRQRAQKDVADFFQEMGEFFTV